MHYITDRNERLTQRHALVLAIAFHLALVAMLYFKMSGESARRLNVPPEKVKLIKKPPTAYLGIKAFQQG